MSDFPNCRYCGAAVSDPMSPTVVGPKLLAIGSWERWALSASTFINKFKNARIYDNPVELVNVRGCPDVGEFGDYWGEYPQGTTFYTYIIFKIGDRFYKAEGTGDSYGEVTWHPALKAVEMREEIITTYEVVGRE